MKLADATKFFKRSVIIFISLIFLYFFLKFAFATSIVLYKVLFPPKPAIPTMTFGKIPSPTIDSYKVNGDIKYVIDTISGKLPTNLPNQLPVYPITKPTRNILAEQNAKLSAARFGFKNEAYTAIDTITWKWQSLMPQRSLTLNILTYNYDIKPNFAQLNLFLRKGEALNQSSAITNAYTVMSSHPYLEVKRDKVNEQFTAKTSFAKINQEVLEEASSLSDAQFTKVDVFKKLIYNETTYIIYGERYDNSYINFLFTNEYANINNLLLAHVEYYPFDAEKGSTYPLKNIFTAWDKLQKGEGTITKIKGENEDRYQTYTGKEIKTVYLKSVELAYILEEKPEFIQPIYVFIGKYESPNGETGDFVSYIPALDDNVLK